MKKTVIGIGKAMLKLALFVVAALAFVNIFAEPVELLSGWADGLLFIASKPVSLLVVYLCYKAWPKSNKEEKEGAVC